MVGRGQPDGNGVSSGCRMRLRTHLGVLAVAVLLPVLVFSVIAVLLVLRLERQAAEKQIAETAKRIARRSIASWPGRRRVFASSRPR